MTRIRHLAFLLLLMTLAVLGGCGGGGDDGPAAVQLDAARTARATLGTAGGSITATAADGRRYTLTVPPGALATATEITATPVISMGDAPLAAGLKGAVRFAPSGLVFAQPASLLIEGVGPPKPGLRGVGFSRSNDGQVMRLLLPQVSDGAFEVPVFHFSDVGVAEASATEIASVPVATPAQVVFERMHDLLARGNIETDAQAEAALGSIFEQMVKPALDAAEVADDITLRERALIAYEGWLRSFVLIDVRADAATVNATLAGQLTSARPRAAELLKRQLGRFIARCASDTENLGFEFAMAERDRAADLGLALAEFGLAPADTLRQMNDCVRLIVEARAFPETVAVGTPRSLDAQARLLFAAAPQELVGTPTEFTVSSSDATVAAATGFSDADGVYTVVVTPQIDKPEFSVKACYVLDPLFRGGGITDLCTTITAPPRTVSSVVLAGRARRILDGADPEAGVSFTQRGTVDMRVRADADGRLTVLEATGRVRKESTATVVCRPDPLSTATRTVSLTEVHQHTITSGRFVSDPVRPGFEFSGPTTSTQQVIRNRDLSCDIETVVRTIDDGDDFGLARIIARELAPDGLPASITLGDFTGAADGAIRGRLLRE